jgi:hypothetical protein
MDVSLKSVLLSRWWCRMDGSEAFPLARAAQWMSRLILSFVKCSLSVSFHLCTYDTSCVGALPDTGVRSGKGSVKWPSKSKILKKSFFFNCQSTWMMQQLLTNFKDHPRNRLLLITGPTHMVGFIQCCQEWGLSVVFSSSTSCYLMINTRSLFLNCHLSSFCLRADLEKSCTLNLKYKVSKNVESCCKVKVVEKSPFSNRWEVKVKVKVHPFQIDGK